VDIGRLSERRVGQKAKMVLLAGHAAPLNYCGEFWTLLLKARKKVIRLRPPSLPPALARMAMSKVKSCECRSRAMDPIKFPIR
jgi:hypothetical protein